MKSKSIKKAKVNTTKVKKFDKTMMKKVKGGVGEATFDF